MRRFRTISLVVAIAVVVTVSLFLVRTGQKEPRYIFLICLDAARPDHLSCYGHTRETSPRIDQLAARGALFEDAISQAPWTIPSIATILSSTFPCQHGARRSEGSRNPYTGLSVNFIETLSSIGYRTALFTGGLAMRGKVPAPELSDRALKWLRGNLANRCFVVIHHYDTHSPYVASQKCIEKLDPGYEGPYKSSFGDLNLLKKARVGRLAEVIDLSEADIRHIKAIYDCQIMRADQSIGAIVDSLDAWNRLDESMIIIFADHGEEFLEHGSIDHGQTVHEESIKVPLIIFCPSLITEPRRIVEQVGLIDIGPTILDGLGIEKPSSFEGTSLMPVLSSEFEASERSTRPCGLPTSCLISEAIARRPEKKSLRSPPWKLIFDPFFGTHALYDISKDPWETENLLELYPEIASRLTDTLLIMEKYYPGGWFIAWRGNGEGTLRGNLGVTGSLIEVLGHNIFPEMDPEIDSLVVSGDYEHVYFRSELSTEWEGIEARLTAPAEATLEISVTGKSQIHALVGGNSERIGLPALLNPSSARVTRKDLRGIYRNTEADLLVLWVDPGSEPTAKQEKQKELRLQLKSLGYIE
jgi:arylsulfatase A-like enzyme